MLQCIKSKNSMITSMNLRFKQFVTRKTYLGLKDCCDWTNSASFGEVRWCVEMSAGPWGRLKTCCCVASVLILYKVLVCALRWGKWAHFIFKWLCSDFFLFSSEPNYSPFCSFSVSLSAVWFSSSQESCGCCVFVGLCCPVLCGLCVAWHLTWHHVSRKRHELFFPLFSSYQLCTLLNRAYLWIHSGWWELLQLIRRVEVCRQVGSCSRCPSSFYFLKHSHAAWYEILYLLCL